MVYLIHFDKRLAHAQHYLGFVEHSRQLQARVKKHRTGCGAKLLKAVNEAGISWEVVRVWENGDRNFERLMKNRKNAKDYCPVCNPQKNLGV